MRRSQAFTLIELSIVLLILSIILGGALSYATRRTQQEQLETTLAKMQVIEDAILAYRRANDRLPCPAVADGVTSHDATFGEEHMPSADPTKTCDGFTLLSGGVNEAVGGDVPFRALGLSADYAFDGWGWRFTYVVDRRATTIGATFSATYPITDTDIGDITIYDLAETKLTEKAVVLLYSHGKNGHGAYGAAGTQRVLFVNNSHELDNCKCGGGATDNAFYVHKASIEDSSDDSSAYDDIIHYKMRWQLFSINPAETPAVSSF